MSREQFFVPLELELGMQAALHQNLIAAELDRLFDLLAAALRAVKHVAFGVLRLAIERAEIADRRADVRVVDVAVDVVGAIRLRMQPARDGIGRAADRRQIVRFQQPQALVGRSAARRRRLYRESIESSMQPLLALFHVAELTIELNILMPRQRATAASMLAAQDPSFRRFASKTVRKPSRSLRAPK